MLETPVSIDPPSLVNHVYTVRKTKFHILRKFNQDMNISYRVNTCQKPSPHRCKIEYVSYCQASFKISLQAFDKLFIKVKRKSHAGKITVTQLCSCFPCLGNFHFSKLLSHPLAGSPPRTSALF